MSSPGASADQRQAAQQWRRGFRALAILAASANVAHLVSALLAPSHGGVPASAYTEGWIGTVQDLMLCAPALLVNQEISLDCFAVWVACLPVLELLMTPLARSLGPHINASLFRCIVMMPLLVICVQHARPLVTDLKPRSMTLELNTLVVVLSAAGAYTCLFWLLREPVSACIQMFGGPPQVQLALVIVLALLTTARWKIVICALAMHAVGLNLHAPFDFARSRLDDALRSQHFTLLERRQGTTGYLAVLQNEQEGFRVLRCDHSLLGGEWVPGVGRWESQTNRPANQVGKVGEPVFTVFVMFEALRLIESNPESTSANEEHTVSIPDEDARALIIGLGIGTVPAAFAAHGINTSVVEIDGAVVELAQRHFDLPRTLDIHTEDATRYVTREARAVQIAHNAGRFDYIVHDVFTGGVEPIELFTVEFIQGLATLLTDRGAIAINYAGDLNLVSTQRIIRTVLSVFPRCRIFRDEPKAHMDAESATTSNEADYANVVIFCRKSPTPFIFRSAREEDFLGSGARQAMLQPQHEIDTSVFDRDNLPLIHSGTTDDLKSQHLQSAVGHWRLMRKVLPDRVWEIW